MVGVWAHRALCPARCLGRLSETRLSAVLLRSRLRRPYRGVLSRPSRSRGQMPSLYQALAARDVLFIVAIVDLIRAG
jgi:hypothetical protein